MQKTRFGVSVGLVGAALYFSALFGGLFSTLLLAGYVLLFEGDGWLRKNAIQSVALLILFYIIEFVLNIIPNLVSMVHNVVGAFGVYFSYNFVSSTSMAINTGFDLIQKIIFIALALCALGQKNISLPGISRMIEKHTA